jgi:hypothetical protein
MASTDSILATYFQSTKLDRQEGFNWYANAHSICETIANEYDIPLNVAVGVMSALSPNNKWARNVEDTENFIRAHCLEIAYPKVCTFHDNKHKAIRIIECASNEEEILRILNGNKTKAFYSCIAHSGNTDLACIDGHAYNIYNGTVSNLKEVPSITDKAFRIIQEAYMNAAEIISNVTGEYHTAAQVQAITWCCYRRLHKNIL